MKHISQQKKLQIQQLLSQGQGTREIAKKCKVSKSTVSRVAQDIEEGIPKNIGGRPSHLSASEKRKLALNIKRGEFNTIKELQTELLITYNKNVSLETIRRALNEEGLKARKKVKKPRLTKNHRKQRLEFAKKYCTWTVEDWKKVLWSDETKVNRFCSDGQHWVWISSTEILDPKVILETIKYGGGNIMLWGCMTWYGPGYISKIDGTMDETLYVEILDECVPLTLKDYKMKKKSFYFQQDNDSKHTSRYTQSYLKDQGWKLLDWPPQSPDLNPIEHLWHHLKVELSKFENPPKDKDEHWKRIVDVYYGIPAEVCQHLISSMPKRLQEVIKAKGGHTKY